MDTLTAVVTLREEQTPDIVTIYFTLQDGTILHYTAGQYITVFFDHTTTREGKAYSLSSSPQEPVMSITVKKIGEFSGLLHALGVGDRFSISQAYGFFNPLTDKPLICIGAGCGVAPIWSVLKDELLKNSERTAHFFYSNKTIRDIAFYPELIAQQITHPGLSIHLRVTRQPDLPVHIRPGRINLDQCTNISPDAMYLVCGSVTFVTDMWRGLKERGISPLHISTETFFE